MVRPSKTTKEIDVGELEMLKKPEARETTAFDPSELQGLIAKSRDEDDLALPVESSTPTLAASSAVAPMPAASTPMFAASSGLTPMPTNDFDDVPGHYHSDTDVPSSSTIPPRVARGSANTPKTNRPITKPMAPHSSISLMPWIVVAIAAAIVVALAFWH